MAKLQTLKSNVQTLGSKIQTVTPGSWRSDKQSSTARGYGYKWQKAREAYLLEHPWCVMCLQEAGIEATDPVEQADQYLKRGLGLPTANVVDHRIPHRGDQRLFWDEGNWQSLCATHHSRDKQRIESQQK